MDAALCSDDSRSYTAAEFAELPADVIGKKRRSLSCLQCEAVAFFRKRSSSGQAACFGARPHDTGCEEATSEQQDNDDPLSVDDYEFCNDHSIVIDLAYGAAETDSSANAASPVTSDGSGSRHTGGPAGVTAMHRRLRTLLFNLIHVPTFQHSKQMVTLGAGSGLGWLPVDRFFVPFARIDQMPDGSRRGFWGVVTDARETSDAIWLNYGRRDDFSVLIEPEHKQEMLTRFRLTDIEDLAGAQVLALGKLRKSSAGKLFVKPYDLAYLTIRPFRPSQ